MSKPALSIIVPVYNTAGYVAACLESIVSQTFDDLEVIVVDDGSTDGSGDICDSFAARDPRVRVIHKANGGVSAARNAALDIAEGEYVGFVDSDDRIEPDTFEKALACARANDADAVQFNFRNIVDGLPREVRSRFNEAGVYRMPLGHWNKSWFSVCLRIVRRSIIEDNSLRFYTSSRQCEDAAFCILFFSYVSEVHCIGDVCYDRVSRPGSVLHTLGKEGYLNRVWTFRQLKDDLAARGRQRAYVRLARRLMVSNALKARLFRLNLKKRI